MNPHEQGTVEGERRRARPSKATPRPPAVVELERVPMTDAEAAAVEAGIVAWLRSLLVGPGR